MLKLLELDSQKALAPLLPSLLIDASKLEKIDNYAELDDKTTTDVTLRLRQTFFAGGKNYYTWQASKKNASFQKANFESKALNLELDLIASYLNILGFEEILDYRIKQVEALSEQLRVVKSRYELGSATSSELRQAQARLAASEAARSLVTSRLRSAQSSLQSFLNISEELELSWPNKPSLESDLLLKIKARALEKKSEGYSQQSAYRKSRTRKKSATF